MEVIMIKCWIIKLLKTLCFCTTLLEINQWNVQCFTPVLSRRVFKHLCHWLFSDNNQEVDAMVLRAQAHRHASESESAVWMSRKTDCRTDVINVHCSDAITGAIASQITGLTIVYSTVYSAIDHRNHQSSALLAFVRGIHRRPVNSPHKGPVTRKMLPFDDVIML